MSNTLFSQMKINFLRLCGNQYSSSDTTRLDLAGICLNQALGIIQGEIKGHPFTLDTGNTVSTVANQPYVDLTPTDIVEIFSVQERIDPNKLKYIPYSQYLQYMADPSRFTGTPNLYYTFLQSVNGSGQNIWQILFVPTPASAITIYYDYIKNLQLTSDSAYSPLPTIYDNWLYAEAKPLFYEIIMPTENDVIGRAVAQAQEARARYRPMILAGADQYVQAQSVRNRGPMIFRQVEPTPAP